MVETADPILWRGPAAAHSLTAISVTLAEDPANSMRHRCEVAPFSSGTLSY